jgi:hypothetical protein
MSELGRALFTARSFYSFLQTPKPENRPLSAVRNSECSPPFHSQWGAACYKGKAASRTSAVLKSLQLDLTSQSSNRIQAPARRPSRHSDSSAGSHAICAVSKHQQRQMFRSGEIACTPALSDATVIRSGTMAEVGHTCIQKYNTNSFYA